MRISDISNWWGRPLERRCEILPNIPEITSAGPVEKAVQSQCEAQIFTPELPNKIKCGPQM